MTMKTSLQLRIGTQLTMTPQLQQAIALLQLSTLELRQEIQQALCDNPLLEEEEEFGEQAVTPPAEDDWPVDIPAEPTTDSDWSDTYPDTGTGTSQQAPDFERDSAERSLHGHLRWQLAMLDLSTEERLIAETLIDAVDLNGYVSVDLKELADGLRRQELPRVRHTDIEATLRRLQQFEPTGIFARDLRECLLLQLAGLPASSPLLPIAKRLVRQFLEALGKNDRRLLKRRLGIDDPQLDATIAMIRSLDPRPGSTFGAVPSGSVIPDLVVRRHGQQWRLNLNPDAIPRLRIQPEYARLIKRADKSRDNTFLKDSLQEARWLIKSLGSRNDTLLRVGEAIISRQTGFLEAGDEAMKPLVLADVAKAVGMHESTVSRVTTNKFIHTPGGVYELKHFFSSQVAGVSEGQPHSSTAIRARIRKHVEQEPASRPLSDSRLVSLLHEEGIQVARRTVAKYREHLGIPPSSERRRPG